MHRPPQRCAHLGLALLFSASALGACASGRDAERDELAKLAAAHHERQIEFQAAQTAFAAQNPMPRQTEYAGIGTLILHGADLGGRPDQEHLHLRFTWVNSGGTPSAGARVRVVIRDPSGDSEQVQCVDLRSLLRGDFSAGSTYTTFLDVPTAGLHRRPGWSWAIELEELPTVLGSESGLVEQD